MELLAHTLSHFLAVVLLSLEQASAFKTATSAGKQPELSLQTLELQLWDGRYMYSTASYGQLQP